ncbi:efflux RND transporter periplasmic adaptor subunit [Patescibacteria group bacterium]|nr:efflux RND transporter periplasmic adaptor subunit [Patescibacteria group bacterium]
MIKNISDFIKKYRIFVILAVVVIIFFVYKNNQTEIKREDKGYTVKKENLKDVLTLSGQIDADEKVSLKFQTSGRLAWVGVKEGDFVKKYQTLASLDQRDLKNRLTKYLNTYAKQRNNFEQTKDDNWNYQYALSQEIRDAVKRILENNQYDLDNTVLDVEYQSLSLEYSSLWSPIEGIVTRVDTPFAGVNITPATAEFDVVNPNTVYFSVTADQTDVVNLKVGDRGEVIFDSFPDERYEGEVSYISYSPKTNEAGTVYEVKISIDDKTKELPLKLGMTGDADFIVKEENDVLALPSGYLKKDKKGKYVFIKIADKKVKRYVKTGDEIDGKTVILEGVNAGDKVYD